jgi:hypothetical protein
MCYLLIGLPQSYVSCHYLIKIIIRNEDFYLQKWLYLKDRIYKQNNQLIKSFLIS